VVVGDSCVGIALFVFPEDWAWEFADDPAAAVLLAVASEEAASAAED